METNWTTLSSKAERKKPIDNNSEELRDTQQNTLFKTAKPLFIGSIPIAASNLLNNLRALQPATEK
jgi:hypothetical protein